MKQQTEKRRNGPNGKGNQIAADIRRDILKGIYKPDGKIVSRQEIEAEYDCGPITVQNAFNKLKRDGTIVIKSNKGTFVSAHPPCLTDYAIVFPFDFDELNHRKSFYSTLAKMALSEKREPTVNFKIYTCINNGSNLVDHKRLYDDVLANRLAGIFFATPPWLIEKTGLFKEITKRSYLPKVAFMPKDVRFPEIAALSCSDDNVIARNFDYFESKKIKRLAVVSAMSEKPVIDGEKEIFAEAKKRGIALPPYNFQASSIAFAVRVRNIVHLLLSSSKATRPQALWITSDTLVEFATQGIVDAGLRVPEDLIVLCHRNFPDEPVVSVGTSWYGADVSKFIDMALYMMRGIREGMRFDHTIEIPNEYYYD